MWWRGAARTLRTAPARVNGARTFTATGTERTPWGIEPSRAAAPDPRKGPSEGRHGPSGTPSFLQFGDTGMGPG